MNQKIKQHQERYFKGDHFVNITDMCVGYGKCIDKNGKEIFTFHINADKELPAMPFKVEGYQYDINQYQGGKYNRVIVCSKNKIKDVVEKPTPEKEVEIDNTPIQITPVVEEPTPPIVATPEIVPVVENITPIPTTSTVTESMPVLVRTGGYSEQVNRPGVVDIGFFLLTFGVLSYLIYKYFFKK